MKVLKINLYANITDRSRIFFGIYSVIPVRCKKGISMELPGGFEGV